MRWRWCPAGDHLIAPNNTPAALAKYAGEWKELKEIPILPSVRFGCDWTNQISRMSHPVCAKYFGLLDPKFFTMNYYGNAGTLVNAMGWFGLALKGMSAGVGWFDRWCIRWITNFLVDEAMALGFVGAGIGLLFVEPITGIICTILGGTLLAGDIFIKAAATTQFHKYVKSLNKTDCQYTTSMFRGAPLFIPHADYLKYVDAEGKPTGGKIPPTWWDDVKAAGQITAESSNTTHWEHHGQMWWYGGTFGNYLARHFHPGQVANPTDTKQLAYVRGMK